MLRAVALCLIVPPSPACSVAFVRTAPPDDVALAQIEESGAIRCTRLPILPAVDSVISVSSGLLALLASTRAQAHDASLDEFENQFIFNDVDDDGADTVMIAAGLGLMAVYAASAIYGFVETSDCREQYRTFERERRAWRRAVRGE